VGAFGEKLRKQREHRGLTLDAISTTTKISTRMLGAIEDERFDQLPGGVFNKGFVRAYARQVGLDEEETIGDYLAALAESQIQSQTILPNFRNSSARPNSETSAQSANARSRANKSAPAERRAFNDRRVEPRRLSDRLVDGRLSSAFPGEVRQSAALQGGVESDGKRTEARPTDDRRNEQGLRVDRSKEDRQIKGQPTADLPHPEPQIAKQEKQRLESVHHEEPVTLRPETPSIKSHRKEDSDEVVPSPPLSFLNLSAPPPEIANTEASESDPAPFRASRPIPWGRLAIPLILITLLLGLWASYRRNHSPQESEPVATLQPPAPSGSTNAEPAPEPTPVAAAPVRVPAPAANPAPGLAVASTSSPVQSSPAPAKTAPPVAPPRQAEPPSDATTSTLPHPPATKPKLPAAFTLIIRASQTSWVSITADGQPVATETLIAPAATSVRATREITIRTRNAAGVSFLLNGKEFPAEGNPGEVRTYTFDASGLRNSAAAKPNQTD
jgi:hypothetical protein